MKIDVSELINNSGARLEASGKAELEPVASGYATYAFKEPVAVSAVFECVGDAIELTAKASGTAVTDCARCSRSVDVPFEFDFEELIATGKDADPDDAELHLEGSIVDLDAITADNFSLYAWSRVLCSEDCKGLCPVCGADLNVSDCGCDRTTSDPRFSGLDELLKKGKLL